MRRYSKKISLIKNSRGVYDLDTIKGCKQGLSHSPKGCYSNCYAYNIANRYGYDFSKSVIRSFKNKSHEENIKSKIRDIDMPFVRIGVAGDPSECWRHTVDVCEKIKEAGKDIVIITKHWVPMPCSLYSRVKKLGLIINTSISALDGGLLDYRLKEYEKMKHISKSVLRVVTCDFNDNNTNGLYLKNIQDKIFNSYNFLDTAFRLPDDHYLVKNRVVHIEKVKFLKHSVYASVYNKDVYLGYCKSCPEMCGINM